MTEVTVRPMTGDEFERWQHDLATAYAQEHVDAGNWTAEEGYTRAREETAALLPEGCETPGMLVLTGTADGLPIGRLWISLTHPRGIDGCAFIYDIEVDSAHRGRGLGRALLAAGEKAAAEGGASALGLNVFGLNTTAVKLYRSAGYRTITQQMRKNLTAPQTSTVTDTDAADPVRRAAKVYERAVFAGESEGLEAAERELAALDATAALARAKLLHARFLTASGAGDHSRFLAGGESGVGGGSRFPGGVERGVGGHDEQALLLERAVDLYRRIGDERGEGEALCWMGIYHQVVRQDEVAAVPVLRLAHEISESVGDGLTVSHILRHLGIAEHRAGRLAEARGLLEESTDLRRAAFFTAGVAANLVGLIYIAAGEGRHADAAAMVAEARALATASGARTILAEVDEAAAAAGAS